MLKMHKAKYGIFIILFMVFTTINAQSLYKTPSGKKYHLSSCRMVENVSKKLSKEDISKYNLTACKICKPPQVGNITSRNSFYASDKSVGKSSTTQCKGKTKKGSRCKHKTSIANGYCYQHTSQNNTSNSFYTSPKISITTCGARTKSASLCKRKTKNNARCYQHS
ncbi:hypothetical protein DFR65_101194 [Oceanihabitans sediminis]|uniref:Uncharacterized protein n=2 Tax=Oceanihabitans sediminis TaxID=1812012 RepID=A0A368P9T2_9FLAO|nr:hypothetical protein DFR65_101194 [Oceanihabitans sediminis]RCU57991.1 hypothetical protein DU428_00965 [Oceanihabitans sediminis]